MIRRIASIVALVWAIGFVWFAIALPQPAPAAKSGAVAVLTGGSGRIARGIEALDRGWAQQMFVSGVAKAVKPHEFALEHAVQPQQMACCVTLGYEAVDTIGNARELAAWLRREKIASVRLVTSDWHMRRAALEVSRAAPRGTRIIEDAVNNHPSLRMLFLEYHKYLSRLALGAVGL
jgi:uncharacterized SAM-binding protein YcdF (DUF218 family)